MMRSFDRASFFLAAVVLATAAHAQSFTFLQPGFTQELYATAPGFFGGVAFAPNGDLWVTPCVAGNGSLGRFSATLTTNIGGTTVHSLVNFVPSNVGCGLTNHPNGFMYSNTTGGITRQNEATGAPAGGPFGPGGNALGIAVDPVTSDLVYVGAGGEMVRVDPNLTTSSIFSTVLQGQFVDGVFFDPTGAFLFCANRSGSGTFGSFGVTILRTSDGSLVQHVILPSEPDGIAFHAASPQFVVTNNLDGTMQRIDFPGNDYTQPGTVSLFASGGFRGDLAQVGADGCLYLTQDGTRLNSGVTIGGDSVVRICGGFAPPPGVGTISLQPPSATHNIGQTHTVTATVTQANSAPLPNTSVSFSVVTGPNAGTSGAALTNAQGQASFTYTGANGVGLDNIQASYVDPTNAQTQNSNVVQANWVGAPHCIAPTPIGPVMGNVGTPLSITIAGEAQNGGPNQFVTLSLTGVAKNGTNTQLPAAISFTTPLPTTGQPAQTTLHWTPNNANSGTWVFTFHLTDDLGAGSSCSVTVQIAECYALVGTSPLWATIGATNNLVTDVVLVDFTTALWIPVTLTSVPNAPIPNTPALMGLDVYMQVVMYNPVSFPNDPIKTSNGLHVKLGTNILQAYGPQSGMSMWSSTVPWLGSNFTFAFNIF